MSRVEKVLSYASLGTPRIRVSEIGPPLQHFEKFSFFSVPITFYGTFFMIKFMENAIVLNTAHCSDLILGHSKKYDLPGVTHS